MRYTLLALPVLGFAFAAAAVDITPDQRDIMMHTIYQSCYQKASNDPIYKQAAAQLKSDVAKAYCSCMGTNLSMQMNADDMLSIAKSHELSPHVHDLLINQSKQCAEQAAQSSS